MAGKADYRVWTDNQRTITHLATARITWRAAKYHQLLQPLYHLIYDKFSHSLNTGDTTELSTATSFAINPIKTNGVFFFKLIFYSAILFTRNVIILVSNVNTYGPVLWHQVISGHNAEYASMRFQLFMG